MSDDLFDFDDDLFGNDDFSFDDDEFYFDDDDDFGFAEAPPKKKTDNIKPEKPVLKPPPVVTPAMERMADRLLDQAMTAYLNGLRDYAIHLLERAFFFNQNLNDRIEAVVLRKTLAPDQTTSKRRTRRSFGNTRSDHLFGDDDFTFADEFGPNAPDDKKEAPSKHETSLPSILLNYPDVLTQMMAIDDFPPVFESRFAKFAFDDAHDDVTPDDLPSPLTINPFNSPSPLHVLKALPDDAPGLRDKLEELIDELIARPPPDNDKSSPDDNPFSTDNLFDDDDFYFDDDPFG